MSGLPNPFPPGVSGTANLTSVRLTDIQLANVIRHELESHIVSNPGTAGSADAKLITINIPFRGNGPKTDTISRHDFDSRIILGTAITIRESDGYVLARCFDGPLPPGAQPQPYLHAYCNRPGKGTDRGIWQLNSKAHPIPDSTADDPVAATAYVYGASAGFTDWAAWSGAPKSGAAFDRAVAAVGDSVGTVIDDTPGPANVPALASLVPWAAGLSKLLGNLTSSSFWLRAGLGLLGVTLVVVGIAEFTGQTSTLKNVATKAALA